MRFGYICTLRVTLEPMGHLGSSIKAIRVDSGCYPSTACSAQQPPDFYEVCVAGHGKAQDQPHKQEAQGEDIIHFNGHTVCMLGVDRERED